MNALSFRNSKAQLTAIQMRQCSHAALKSVPRSGEGSLSVLWEIILYRFSFFMAHQPVASQQRAVCSLSRYIHTYIWQTVVESWCLGIHKGTTRGKEKSERKLYTAQSRVIKNWLHQHSCRLLLSSRASFVNEVDRTEEPGMKGWRKLSEKSLLGSFRYEDGNWIGLRILIKFERKVHAKEQIGGEIEEITRFSRS